MSFFIRGKNFNKPSGKKKDLKGKKKGIKRSTGQFDVNAKSSFPNKKKKKKNLDNEISSDEDELPRGLPEPEHDSDLDAHESTQDKQIRLAKLYLTEIEKQEKERLDSDAVDKDVIARRLKENVLEQSGKLRKTVADTYVGVDGSGIHLLKCKQHPLPITCLVISPDNQFIYSAAKGSGIVKWSFADRCKLQYVDVWKETKQQKTNKMTIFSLAVSSDNRYLVSGGEDKQIHVWNPLTLEHIHTFKGHNGAVTGLVFRRATHQLFSCSRDRCVKVWNLDEMSFVETLLGHHNEITSIDSLNRDRAITSGGMDNTIRIWKIVEESQLIFNGPGGSIDSVKHINDDHFISCGTDGHLCLWGSMKKRPLCSIPNAHGVSPENDEPNWISSVATFLNTDLVASGSQDGHIRLWKCGDNFRSLTKIMEIPVTGFSNTMAFTSDGQYLVVGVGQEHRFGRWWKIKEAKNGILIIPFIIKC